MYFYYFTYGLLLLEYILPQFHWYPRAAWWNHTENRLWAAHHTSVGLLSYEVTTGELSKQNKQHGTGLKITFQPFIKCWMYLSTLKRPNTFEMVKLKANNFYPVCKFKCSVHIWTTEHLEQEKSNSWSSFVHCICLSFTPDIYSHTELKWDWSVRIT